MLDLQGAVLNATSECFCLAGSITEQGLVATGSRGKILNEPCPGVWSGCE
jgi:hypothetical protein